MAKNEKLIWIGIGAVIVVMLMTQFKKEIGVGCITPTNYNNCNWVLDTYKQTTGQSPTKLYVFGWHTSSCTGSNYASCIDTSSISCGGDATDVLLNTCNYGASTGCDGNPEGTIQCGSSGGSATTEKCINGQWVTQQTCQYACSLGSCLSSPCTSPNANIGQFSCRNGDVMKCTSTSVWTKINDCEGYTSYTVPCKNEKIARATEIDAKNDCTAKVCNTAADADCDGKVVNQELLNYISLWISNTVSNSQLLTSITAWINS